MKIAYYQYRPLFGKVRHNLDKVVQALTKVEADLVVLPELAFTGYCFRDREETRVLAEDPDTSTTVDALRALCRRRGFHLVTGFAERRADKCFNSALLVPPRGALRIYRKLHLFNDEKLWFDPGDTDLEVYEIGRARIGMMICFDWIFPEVVRVLALRGADVICHPSNLVLDYCQRVMTARCLENGVFAVTTNRTGADRRAHGSVRFTGRSQVVSPRGEVLQRAPMRSEALHTVTIDPATARDKYITPRNDRLLDRRPQYYHTLTETFRADA